VDRARRLRVGDPADPATEIGPVISRGQYDRVLRFVGEADLLLGGTRAEGFD
jgi:acyl-CoA reductase-like NAD-dependent aldehyde dehydrogenase